MLFFLLSLLTVRFQLSASTARRWLGHPTSPFLHVAPTVAPTDGGLPWYGLTLCDNQQWLEESARHLRVH